MRKLIFTLFFVATTLFASAQQIDREMVLLEIATGTWCVYCPGAAMGAHDLLENGHPVAVIKNHNGDSYANVYSNARNAFYGIPGYPTTFFDGGNQTVGGSASSSLYTQFLAKVNQRLTVPTSFKIDIFGTQVWNDYDITLRIEKAADYAMENIVVHLVLTESDIPVNWFNQTQVDNVNRLMVPDQFGTPLTIETGETQFVELNFTFNNSWIKPNTELVAFLQNNATKEVMHSTKVALLDLEALEILQADFYAEVSEACPNTPIAFTNTSTGGDSYLWEFPGGTPAESTEENPEVYYEEAGSYDVTLTVFKDDDSNSLTMEDYITILDAPEVTFEEVPVLCEFWDPYELTQGHPEGGTYSGEGVVDGYFHPQDVGVGFYEVTYSFTNENDCTVEVMQVLEVDACTGIEETQNTVAQVFPNPTNGKLNVEFNAGLLNQASVKIYNSLGHLVYEQKSISLSADRKQEIDLGGQAEGIYLIHIQQGETSQYQRIVLKY